jgi:TonB-dependent receptor
LSLENQTEFWDRPFGYIASLTYKNGYSLHNETRNYYILGANRSLEARHEIDNYRISNFNVLWGGVVNASYMPATDQKVSLSTTYTRSLDDEVRSYSEFPNRDHNLDEKGTRFRWVERSLFSTQVSGEKHFFSTELDWRATYSLATRNEPDTRETLYESNIGENNFKLADESQSGSRFFSDLVDNNVDAGLDWRVPFYQFVSLPGEFRLGASFVYRDREVDSRRFRFKPQDFHQVNIYQEPEEIFTPENIDSKGFQLMEDTRATDNYKGKQTLGAGYALMDFLLTTKLRVATGARLEVSNQEVTTFELFNPNNVPIVGAIKTTDVLPAINITYKGREDMNLRSAMSKTLSRPSFREMSEFEFTDIAGHAIIGNPELERAFIQNYDLRWEWYPRTKELVAISLFYKDFERPIERIILPATEPASSWQNAESAFNYGAEVELRKNLAFIKSFLADFSISSNLALIKSQVKLAQSIGIDTSKKRSLQGQSPYILNLMASYDNPRLGTTATLLYNIFGRRISEAGIAGTPDIYEQPFAQLDFVFSQSLAKLNIKLTGKNLLNPEVTFRQGDKTQRAYKKGRSFGLGVSYNF